MIGKIEVGMIYVRYYRGILDGLEELIEVQLEQPPLEVITLGHRLPGYIHVYSLGGWSGQTEESRGYLFYVYEGVRKEGEV